MDHAVVSSSRIRSAVEASDFALAEKLRELESAEIERLNVTADRERAEHDVHLEHDVVREATDVSLVASTES